MAKNYNDGESGIWKVIGIAGNAIMMNLLFIVFCIPIVTIGPAICGLFSAVRFFIRGDSWISGFFKGFKTNIWRVLPVWLISLVAMVFVGNDVLITANNYDSKYLASLIISSVILLLVMMFVSAFLVYNVYFPGKMLDMLTEVSTFMFKVPLHVLVVTVVFWAPLGIALGLKGVMFEFVLVFIALYFSVSAFLCTFILKKPLIKVLNAKKEAGEEIIR